METAKAEMAAVAYAKFKLTFPVLAFNIRNLSVFFRAQ